MGVALEDIYPDDVLFRRLAWSQVRKGRKEANSTAYMVSGFPDAEISVYVERLLDYSMDEVLERLGKPHFGYGKLIAKDVGGKNLKIRHAPVEDNYAHAVITGCSTLIQCAELADMTEVIKVPTEPPKKAPTPSSV